MNNDSGRNASNSLNHSDFRTILLPEPRQSVKLENIPEDKPVEAHTIVTSDELIYLSDEFQHRLLVYDHSGSLAAQIGSKGANPGQFHFPKGMSLCNDKILVCDSLNHRIQAFSLSGEFLCVCDVRSRSSIELDEPVDLKAIDKDLIMLADRRNRRILTMDRDCRAISIFQKTTGDTSKGTNAEDPLVQQNNIHISTTARHNFVTQISQADDFLWVADGWSLSAYGPVNDPALMFDLFPFACYRGLVAEKEFICFLDEISGKLVAVDYSGNRVLLEVSDSRISGFGRTKDNQFSALAGNRLISWTQEDFSGVVHKHLTRCKRPKNKEMGQLLRINRQKEQVAMNILEEVDREAGFNQTSLDCVLESIQSDRVRQKAETLIIKYGEGWFAEIATKLNDHSESFNSISDLLLEIDFQYSARGLLVSDQLQGLEAFYYRPRGQELILKADSLMTHSRSLMKLFNECFVDRKLTSEQATETQQLNVIIASSYQHFKSIALNALEKTTNVWQKLKKIFKKNTSRILSEDILHTVELISKFKYAKHIADHCCTLLEELISAGDDLPGLKEDPFVRKYLEAGRSIPLRFLMYYRESSESPKDFSHPLLSIKVLPDERLEEFTSSVCKLIELRLHYFEEESDEKFAEYFFTFWNHIILSEKLIEDFLVYVPNFWPITESSGTRLLKNFNLGLPEIKKVVESESEELEVITPEPDFNECLCLLFKRLQLPDCERFTPEQIADTIFDIFKIHGYLDKVLIHLVPWLNAEQWMKLARELLRRLANIPDAENSALVVKSLLAFKKLLSDPGVETRGAEFVGKALDRTIIRNVVGKRFYSVNCMKEALPYLETLAKSVRDLWTVSRMRMALKASGEKEKAQIYFDYCLSSSTLSYKERVILFNRECPEETAEALSYLKKYWFFISAKDIQERFECINYFCAYGFYREAIALLNSWIDQSPGVPQPLFTLAQIYFKIGAFDDALRNLHKYEQLFGENDASLNLMARCYLNLNDYGLAIGTGERIEPRGRFSNYNTFVQCLIYLRKDEVSEVENLLGESTYNDSSFLYLEPLRITSLFRQFRLKEAIASSAKYEFYSTVVPVISTFCVLANIKQGRLEEAEHRVEQLLLLSFKMPVTQLAKAMILLKQGRIIEARRYFRYGLWHEPFGQISNIAGFHYGCSFESEPPGPEDRRFIDQMKVERAQLPLTKGLSAFLSWTEGNTSAHKQLPFITKDIDIDSHLLLMIRGWIAYKSGHYEKAVESLEPIIGTFGCEESNFVYAKAMLKLGKPKDALKALEGLKIEFADNEEFNLLVSRIKSDEKHE